MGIQRALQRGFRSPNTTGYLTQQKKRYSAMNWNTQLETATQENVALLSREANEEVKQIKFFFS